MGQKKSLCTALFLKVSHQDAPPRHSGCVKIWWSPFVIALFSLRTLRNPLRPLRLNKGSVTNLWTWWVKTLVL